MLQPVFHDIIVVFLKKIRILQGLQALLSVGMPKRRPTFHRGRNFIELPSQDPR